MLSPPRVLAFAAATARATRRSCGCFSIRAAITPCYSAAVIHLQVRQARIDHGLSQTELARRAGVPRSQLRKFEDGGNITLATFTKILEQLPNLKSLAIGTVNLSANDGDRVLRIAAEELIASARRFLALLDTRGPSPVPEPAGATRFEPSAAISPELEQRLRKLEAQARTTGATKKRDA